MLFKKCEQKQHRLGAKLSLFALAAVGVYTIGSSVHSRATALMHGCKCMMNKMKKKPAHTCDCHETDQSVNIS